MKHASFAILFGTAACMAPLTHAQVFLPTGPMNVARTQHAAALLPNGKVLVTGGQTPSGLTNTAEIYDPASGTWRYTLHPMNAARTFHSATTLSNGKVLIAAGGDTSGSLASAEIFDPVSESFTPTGSLNFARHTHRAILLSDGRVHVVAGSSTVSFLATNTAEIYDPSTGQWTSVASLSESLFTLPCCYRTAECLFAEDMTASTPHPRLQVSTSTRLLRILGKR